MRNVFHPSQDPGLISDAVIIFIEYRDFRTWRRKPVQGKDNCELGFTMVDPKQVLEGNFSCRSATHQYCSGTASFVAGIARKFLFNRKNRCHPREELFRDHGCTASAMRPLEREISADHDFEPQEPLKDLVKSLAGRNIISSAFHLGDYIRSSGMPEAGFQFPPDATFIDIHRLACEVLGDDWKRLLPRSASSDEHV